MILVILGTQDKSFKRLLIAVQEQIDNGNIKDKVVVQAGNTVFKSNEMEIYDLVPMDKFDELIDKADIVITHAGVGSIITSLKKGKKIIAAPRLKKYKESENDHQLEILNRLEESENIIALRDFSKLNEKLIEAKNFKPKPFKHNTPNMVKIIKNYIENS